MDKFFVSCSVYDYKRRSWYVQAKVVAASTLKVLKETNGNYLSCYHRHKEDK